MDIALNLASLNTEARLIKKAVLSALVAAAIIPATSMSSDQPAVGSTLHALASGDQPILDGKGNGAEERQLVGAAEIEALRKCASKPPEFWMKGRVEYARLSRDEAQPVNLFREHPTLCMFDHPDDPKVCERAMKVANVLQSNGRISFVRFAVGSTCGGWAHVRYDDHKSVTVGWIEEGKLRRNPESDPELDAYEITKGVGIDICEVYLKRLNLGGGDYCDRPEDTSVAGFQWLERRELTWEEVMALRPEQFDKRLTGRLMRGLRAWRYTEPLDVENSGKPLDVVLWQGHALGIPCGDAIVNWLKAEPNPPVPTWGYRSSVEPLVLDGKGAIDWDKSRQVFGHPKGDEYTVSESYGGPGFKRKFKKFRPIGPNVGIFEYKKTFYIDTFFDVWGDAEDLRRDDVQTANVLGVFLRRNGSLTQVCEFQRKSTDIPLYHTYDGPEIGPN